MAARKRRDPIAALLEFDSRMRRVIAARLRGERERILESPLRPDVAARGFLDEPSPLRARAGQTVQEFRTFGAGPIKRKGTAAARRRRLA